MFLQIMSIICTNSFIVHSSIKKKDALNHKKFTLEMIAALMIKAKEHYLPPHSTPTSSPALSSTPKRKPPRTKNESMKRMRTKRHSSVAELLRSHPERKVPPISSHTRAKSKVKSAGACQWCAQVLAEKRATGEKVDWNKGVKRTAYYCKRCLEINGGTKIFLCAKHHEEFHLIA